MPGMMICTPMSRTFFLTDAKVTIGFAAAAAAATDDDDDEDGTVDAGGPEPGLLLLIPLIDGTIATEVALVV